MIVRPAVADDLPRINEIYNEAVRESVFAFDTEERTADECRDWFTAHRSPYSVLVGVVQNDVAGWASLSPWARHGAYAATAEHSLFVDHRYRRQGIGKALLHRVVAEAQHGGFHVLVGRITDGNEISRRLHHTFGFEDVGKMREVGYKLERRLDVWIVLKILVCVAVTAGIEPTAQHHPPQQHQRACTRALAAGEPLKIRESWLKR